MTYIARRRREYLTPLKKNEIPRNFLFVDTETYINNVANDGVEFPFRLGVCTYVEYDNQCRPMRKHTYRFSSALEFIQVIQRHKRTKTKLHIIAHNVGFDIRVLSIHSLFETMGWDSEPPIINEKTYIWRVYTSTGNLVFLDTANFGVMSVEQLGKDLNYPKLEINFETCTDEELFAYCEQDVNIIERFMTDYIAFIHDNQLGSFKITLAGQAMCAFRSRFMTTRPFIHCDGDTLALEREAYHGGRTEAFVLGEYEGGNYDKFDVTSMYPYAMISYPLPIRLRGYTTNVNPKYLPLRLKKWYVIADVTLRTPVPIFCQLRDHKLTFPTGKFRTVLHHCELEQALKKGEILQIHRCAVYDKGDLFGAYVKFFHAERQNAKLSNLLSWSLMCKLFMNSLYGKFGQLQPQRVLVGEQDSRDVWRMPCIDMDTNSSYSELCWYGKVYREWKEGETSISIPAIAGAITAAARVILWEYIEKAGMLNVYYCDTDSLFTNSNGSNRLVGLVNHAELGMLKHEGHARSLCIYGNKDYRFGAEIRTKGVPSKAVLIEQGKWRYVQFQGYKGWLSQGAKGGAIGKWMVKQRRSHYNKGKVLPTGRVIPFYVNSQV